MSQRFRLLGLVAALAGAGCFSPDQVPLENNETDNPNTSSGGEPLATSSDLPAGSTSSSTSAGGMETSTGNLDPSSTGTTHDDGSSSTGDAPTCALENGNNPLFECNTFTQDCPSQEKCVPLGGNATECFPTPNKPVGSGGTCNAPGGELKGNDTCGVGLLCDGVGGALNTGTCVRLCGCDGDAAVCPATSVCVTDLVPICRRRCNPIADENCGLADECVSTDDGPFACVERTGVSSFGDECARSSDCDAGYCAPAAAVPGCSDLRGSCCTTYCDLGEPLASQGCPGFSDGQECVPLFNADTPEGLEDVGLCAS